MASKTPSTDDLIRFVDRWRPRKIVVAGDFMLDRYVHGNAERLSPDAPVPVLSVQKREHRPGGAANVCLDLRALQCEVACVGVAADDDAGRLIRTALREAGCDISGLLAEDGPAGRPTTVKENFVGLAQHRHPQRMFRVDEESREPISARTAASLAAAARTLLKGADVLCLEDYGKGVLTPELCATLIEAARKAGVPALVDPAATDDYARYAGATCITPNRTEAARATGLDPSITDDATLRKMGQTLLRKLRLNVVALTLDKQGMLLLEKGKPARHIPTQARAVYDVVGAGDMVLAMLAAAIANGADWPTAARLANTAAGLEVEKVGVVPIPLSEVLLSLLQQNHQQLGKVRDIEQLAVEAAAHRDQGHKIVFTNGCFDMLHAGHIHLLRQARAAGDLLIVAINSDASIRRLKGPNRPVNTEADRVLVLSELQSVDYIIVFEDDTPIPLLRRLKPDVLVKGGDYTHKQVVGYDIVEAYGGQVLRVPPVKGRSTTNMIAKIAGAGGA